MTKRAIRDMRIENLIYKLNASAQQSKECVDRLWTLETEKEAMRLELLTLINEKATDD